MNDPERHYPSSSSIPEQTPSLPEELTNIEIAFGVEYDSLNPEDRQLLGELAVAAFHQAEATYQIPHYDEIVNGESKK